LASVTAPYREGSSVVSVQAATSGTTARMTSHLRDRDAGRGTAGGSKWSFTIPRR
jgi:hypothetical protein